MSEPKPEIVLKIHEAYGWKNERQSQYTNYQGQFDKLYNDIESGKFGDNAKTGEWYLWVKGIKDANPKPANLSTLESELQTLLESEE